MWSKRLFQWRTCVWTPELLWTSNFPKYLKGNGCRFPVCKQLKSSHLDSVICIPVLQSIRRTLKEYYSPLLTSSHCAAKIHVLPCPKNSLIILLWSVVSIYSASPLLHDGSFYSVRRLFKKWTSFISPAHHEPIAFCYISRTNNVQVWRGSETTRFRAFKRTDPKPQVGVPNTTLIPLLQVNSE